MKSVQHNNDRAQSQSNHIIHAEHMLKELRPGVKGRRGINQEEDKNHYCADTSYHRALTEKTVLEILGNGYRIP